MVLVLIVIFIFFEIWAALVAAGTVTTGTYGVLLASGLAAYAVSLLPWGAWFKRYNDRPGV